MGRLLLELIGQLHWALVCVGVFTSIVFSALALWGRERGGQVLVDLSSPLPPVSILKPFDGTEPGLQDNLWSYLQAEHYGAPREVFFCTDRDNTRGIAVVEALLRRLEVEPQEGVTARLLLPEAGERPWITRKLWHMARGFAAATHDIIVNGDSGTRLEPDTLPALVRTLVADPRRGASWTSYAVEGSEDLGVRLTAAAWTATSMSFFVVDAVYRVTGNTPLLVGGLFALRRAAVEELDGFAACDGYLTEDLEVGRRIHRNGWGVAVSRVPVVRYLASLSVREFWDRQQRWNVILWRFRDPMRVPYPLTMCGLAVAPVTFVLGSLAFPERTVEYGLALVALVVSRVLYALFLLVVVSRRRPRLDAILLLPFVDFVFLVTWARGPFVRRIAWRDTHLLVGPEGRVTLA